MQNKLKTIYRFPLSNIAIVSGQNFPISCSSDQWMVPFYLKDEVFDFAPVALYLLKIRCVSSSCQVPYGT